MTDSELMSLLSSVKDGGLSLEEAFAKLSAEPFADLGFAKPDFKREVRQGRGEVIYGGGKTAEQIAAIGAAFVNKGFTDIIITRLAPDKAAKVTGELWYDAVSRIGVFAKSDKAKAGCVAVVCAGTSDLPVAEEAAVTAEILGSKVERVYDVGVSGLHRLLANLDVIRSAKAVVAVAGMEGALASVVGGLVSVPVVAVPTSVGYGASFGGVAALLSMLNSCSSGVSVVNIDNGFGAGYLADMINRKYSQLNSKH
ncbi:MAG: nickel pincer cofactor biosynthesis protein LarB [Oscillospiraceae bacterium]|jgi:NCAIR mutase (PurE)-related protein|nr:nickel pincer cofactor biosynthesis protein LarB [Oscillospiraceae bacterium]